MKLMVKRRDKRKFTAIVAAKGAPLGVVGGWVGGIFMEKQWQTVGK